MLFCSLRGSLWLSLVPETNCYLGLLMETTTAPQMRLSPVYSAVQHNPRLLHKIGLLNFCKLGDMLVELLAELAQVVVCAAR